MTGEGSGFGEEVLKRPFSARRPADKAPTPAFMQIEGRLVSPLPPEATTVNTRKFWLVQPWVIVSIVMAIMVALVIPGLFLDLNRGF